MPMKSPRIKPLQDHEADDAQNVILDQFRKVNAAFGVARTMARHPRMLTAFRTWATYVMIDKNKLPEREREILALRTAFRIKSDYIWSRHLSYAKRAGLSDEEVQALKRAPEEFGSNPVEVALVRVADALVDDFFIPDEIWDVIAPAYEDEQLIDAVFVVGHFCMMGMFLNTAGAELDPDVSYDPDLDRFA